MMKLGYAIALLLMVCGIYLFLTDQALAHPANQEEQNELPSPETYEIWVREALTAAQRGDRLGLEQVAEQLTTTTAVQTSDGTRVPVDNRWLVAALEAPDPDLAAIADRLGTVLNGLVRAGRAAPDDALQQLEAILSSPPFASAETQNNNVLAAFLDWIFDILERILAPVVDVGTGVSDILGWLVVGVSILALIGVLLYLALNLRRSLTKEAQAQSDEDPEAGLTAGTALQQAVTLARGGDYRTAVRYLYLHSLLWLDEQKLLRYDRSLTNREYLDSLAAHPQLRAQLVPIVDTFDRVWYGKTELDADSFQTYQDQVQRLRRVVVAK